MANSMDAPGSLIVAEPQNANVTNMVNNTESLALHISDPEILDLLSMYDEPKRINIAMKALRIGLIAMRDIESVGNVDYVEKEFSKFKSGLEKEIDVLREEVQIKLKEADKVIQENLQKQFDPETGIMCRTLSQYLGDGGKLSDLFDENNNTSAVSKIRKIMNDYFDEDSSKVVKLLDVNNPLSPLHAFKKDLFERLVCIQGEIKASETAEIAVKAEAQKGTRKGIAYEELAFGEIEKIASILGDTCLPTGNQAGQILGDKRGDFVIKINPTHTGGAELRFVIETKDKEMYLNGLLDELDGAMRNRSASLAIGLISGQTILKDTQANMGLLRDYTNKIVCVLDKEEVDSCALEVAYKLARSKILLNLKAKEMKSEHIDVVKATSLNSEIVKKLDEFGIIKGTLTTATTAIGKAQIHIDELKVEISEKLNDLHTVLKP